ncbi:succinylglutamate desuccinylase/aspartoacylase family protein [Spongorhabdus nitratireducens]
MAIADLEIGGFAVKAGQTRQIRIAVAKLYTDTEFSVPVHVIRSRKPGPTVFVSAAVHGDELNGVEIIRRLIKLKSFKVSAGTLILVPMVNVYGVLNQSRYMPDRRDLNRSFPGSAKGSLAGRLADMFLTEIVSHCDYGIDLHTGAIHRSNLPQVRANLQDKETLALAQAFGVPVLLNANIRDNSLRQAAVESNTRILLYEGGEALRFDEVAIRAGVHGVVNVLAQLGMVRSRRKLKSFTPYIANNSAWIRASASGIVNSLQQLGDQVEKGTPLATIGSPLGETIETVRATRSGIIIGKQNIPLIQEGEAMFHIAFFSEPDDDIAEDIETMQETLQTDESVLE